MVSVYVQVVKLLAKFGYNALCALRVVAHDFIYVLGHVPWLGTVYADVAGIVAVPQYQTFASENSKLRILCRQY